MHGGLGALVIERVVVDARALQVGGQVVVDVLLVVAGGLVVAQLVEGQGQEQRAANDDGGPPVTGRQLDEAHAVGSHAWRDGIRNERGGETAEERD